MTMLKILIHFYRHHRHRQKLHLREVIQCFGLIPNGVDCQSADQRPIQPLSLRGRLQDEFGELKIH